MRKNIIISFMLVFSILVYSKDQHSIFTTVLQEYVHEGYVDYSSLKNDTTFNQYLKQLENTQIEKLSQNDRLAFWINAYNAFTIQRILESYPIESINDLHRGGRILAHVFGTTVWDEEFITIDSKNYSLNDIEHEIIRKRFDDPRVHFALVCASISCPKLRDEAFEGDKIDFQLKDQTKDFLADISRNKFDSSNSIAHLSKILDWYESDFAENDKQLLLFLIKYLDPVLAKNISDNIDRWEIQYLDYDWNLNDYKQN